MDKLVYWIIAILVFGVAWAQWFFNLSAMVMFFAWLLAGLLVAGLLHLSGLLNPMIVYVKQVSVEFHKIHWTDLHETRALTVSVSLMIAIFSVMLWLMDQVIVLLLTRWV